MDSSPDLSLKLRRGSSDSRDSFYLNLAQGVDSDIEEVVSRPSCKDEETNKETDNSELCSLPSPSKISLSQSPPPLHMTSPPLHMTPPPVHMTPPPQHMTLSQLTKKSELEQQTTIPKQTSSPIHSESPQSQESASPPSQRGSSVSNKSNYSKSPPSQRASLSSQKSVQAIQKINSTSKDPSNMTSKSPPSKRASISSQRSQPQSPSSQAGFNSQKAIEKQSLKSPSSKRPSITSQRSIGSVQSQCSQPSPQNSPLSHHSQHSHHSIHSHHSVQILNQTEEREETFSSEIHHSPLRKDSPEKLEKSLSISSPIKCKSSLAGLNKESSLQLSSSPPLPPTAFIMQTITPPDSPPNANEYSEDDTTIDMNIPVDFQYSNEEPLTNISNPESNSAIYQTSVPESDSIASSPSPPPTPPPPPPLSIPPPLPDPLPPRHEPKSPVLSPLSISPPTNLIFQHHSYCNSSPKNNEISYEASYTLVNQAINMPTSDIVDEKKDLTNTDSIFPESNANQEIYSNVKYENFECNKDKENHITNNEKSFGSGSSLENVEEKASDEGNKGKENNKNYNPNENDPSIMDNNEETQDIPRKRVEDKHIDGNELRNADSEFIIFSTPIMKEERSASDNNGSETSYELDDLSDQINQILEKDMIHGTSIADDFNVPNIDWLKNNSNSNSPARQGSSAMEVPPNHPSPISPANILVSSETVSHNSSSPSKSSRKHYGSHHRVTIDESNLPMSGSTSHHQLGMLTKTCSSEFKGDSPPLISTPLKPGALSMVQQIGATTGSQGDHLGLMYHSSPQHPLPILPAIRKTSRISSYYTSPSSNHHHPEIKAGDALATTFSALYGKLLVVMGIAFPMAEVISTYIPPSFYEVYYLYLYVGSMLFLLFMYATLLWGRPKLPTSKRSAKIKSSLSNNSASDSMEESDTESGSSEDKRRQSVTKRRPSLLAPIGGKHYHYGSFYLRMGAVAFGIGSMIYSGLEFGQYFELERDTKCHNVLLALTPATRMAFIFIQMYFIFLNNEQIKVYRHKIIARFGLMHMIGTNLSVWLNVLIQETKHEILTFYDPENRTLRISHRLGNRMQHFDHSAHLRVARGLKGPYQIFECRRTNIIGTLVQDASPFLFPCTIEYSLICAAILYVMWRSISHPSTTPPVRIESQLTPMKRSPHHYSVDCARAHKGLFIGILILVLTIISLILFFVLISRPEFITLAVTEVTICELTIYATATIATVIGMIQVRVLQYDAYRSFTLDDILLVGAQSGLFLYSTFTVIGGHFTLRKDTILVLITALASIVQTAFQTMFILDASRRQAVSPEHIRRKPGREIVTFMLVANLAMWAISTLEKSRAESHPIQLNFYGLWAWTIITHVSMPLAIFYRFHSTVCLCEIWKRAYKLKPTYM